MTIKDMLSVIGTIAYIGVMIGLVPFVIFVVYPFFNGFTSEKRFEKFIAEQCLQGNEIAIRIKRENIRFFADSDYKLGRAAVEGNEYAIKALKLDQEPQKYKVF